MYVFSEHLPDTDVLAGLLNGPIISLDMTAATWNMYTAVFGVRPETF